jgi:hypothetical protein
MVALFHFFERKRNYKFKNFKTAGVSFNKTINIKCALTHAIYPKVFFHSYALSAAWQSVEPLIKFLYEHDYHKLIGRVGSMPQDRQT